MDWTFKSVPAIRAAVNSGGSHYFSPDTMRFFGTKCPSTKVWAGRIFILSHMPPSGTRVYGVHILEFDPEGNPNYTIQNADEMLSDAVTSIGHAKAIAEWLAFHYAPNWPDHFDYEATQSLNKAVADYREKHGI